MRDVRIIGTLAESKLLGVMFCATHDLAVCTGKVMMTSILEVTGCSSTRFSRHSNCDTSNALSCVATLQRMLEQERPRMTRSSQEADVRQPFRERTQNCSRALFWEQDEISPCSAQHIFWLVSHRNCSMTVASLFFLSNKRRSRERHVRFWRVTATMVSRYCLRI